MLHHLLLGAALSIGQADTPPPTSSLPTELAPFLEQKRVVEAPAEEEEEAASQRWLLMRSLQGTWLGTAMYDARMQVYGWTAMSFTPSTATHQNTPVVWNFLANEFLLQQHWTRIERSVVTSGTTKPTFGFRGDMLFGSDYRFTLQRGICNRQLTANGGLPNTYGCDPISFYGEGYFPTVFQGTDVKVGRWFTPFGVESLEAVSSPLASKAYAFNWAPPFTHTGALFTMNLGRGWTTQLGPCVGNDVWLDKNVDEFRMVGTVGYTQPNGKNVATFGYSLGHGSFDVPSNFNRMNVLDFVWIHNFNPTLTYTFESIYGYQNRVPIGDTQQFTNWLSLVNYLFWTINKQATSVTRLEFFNDFQGARTGFEGLYSAITTGIQFRPIPSIILLPELRYDYNGQSPAFEGKHGIFTAGTELIFRW